MKNKGFTLIELLVVVAIIGLLASIILSALNTARAKARDVRRISDMHNLISALDLMYDTEAHYPRLDWHDSTEANFLDYLVRQGYLIHDPIDPLNYLGSPHTLVYSYSSFRESPSGPSGQYYQIDYDTESETHTVGTQCGLGAGDGRWITTTHCHVDYPAAILCSDPYLSAPATPADCLAIQDSDIDL